jgi:hypothetical protein
MKLDQLAALYDADGPFVTIYRDVPTATEDAATKADVGWRNTLRELTGSGVDEATRDALSAVVDGDGIGGSTRVLVASRGHVHLATWLPDPPVGDLVTVRQLPHLFPLVASLSARIPHVVVLADRDGADVLGYAAGPQPTTSATTDDPARWPSHKTGLGGWAAKRYDASVEESWDRSAKDVAALVAKVARDVSARLVVGCGDERAISLLREHLPTRLATDFVVVPGGGRHADGGDDHVRHRVLEAVAQRVASDEQTMLDRFGDARGQGKGAREGVQDVVEALQRGEVDTLLLTDRVERSDRSISFGPAPMQLAVDGAQLDAMGATHAEQAPLVDVVLRAAIGSGAEVAVVSDAGDAAPRDGTGALLRFEIGDGSTSG